MDKIEYYRIFWEEDISSLEKTVNQIIRDDPAWKPVSVFIKDGVFYQAMYRDPDTVDALHKPGYGNLTVRTAWGSSEQESE